MHQAVGVWRLQAKYWLGAVCSASYKAALSAFRSGLNIKHDANERFNEPLQFKRI
jgi:hypothetical protein